MKELKDVLSKILKQDYANFKGRASRREFWLFFFAQYLYLYAVLIVFYIALIFCMMFSVVTSQVHELGGVFSFVAVIFVFVLFFIFILPVLIPSLAVTVRRLHDIGYSGWWLLLSFIPFGGLILVFFLIKQGYIGRNEYGEDPRIDEYKEYLSKVTQGGEACDK